MKCKDIELKHALYVKRIKIVQNFITKDVLVELVENKNLNVMVVTYQFLEMHCLDI